MVHVREGSTDDLLVVGVLLDAGAYGTNNKVRRVPRPLSQITIRENIRTTYPRSHVVDHVS